MIVITPSSSNAQTGRYFSTDRVEVKAINPLIPSADQEYCRCLRQCISALPAFTDEIGNDFYKNDRFSLYLNTVQNATITIKIFKNDQELVTVTDDTYGIILNDSSNFIAGYNFFFYNIWNNHGYGRYYFTLEVANSNGFVYSSTTSPKFELQKYTELGANGTVRIETFQSGLLNHGTNYTVGVPQQIRFEGSLKLTGEVVETDEVILNNNARSTLQIKDQIFPEYELELIMTGAEDSFKVIFDYLFAQTVTVSDYSIFNFVHQPNNPEAKNYRSIPLKRTGIDFNASRRSRRKTFRIAMAYDYKNVFKTNT